MESFPAMKETVKSRDGVPMKPASPKLDDFAGIYEEHSRAVYYFALRMLGDPARAEDVTHDVFLKAFRKIGEFRGKAGLRTWLYRITVNHCKNLLQSWQQRNVFGNSREEMLETTPVGSDTPLRVLEIKELGERIQKTLNQLSEEYRSLLLLAADGTLNYEEMGALGNQTGDAVRGKLYRARRAFIEIFKKSS